MLCGGKDIEKYLNKSVRSLINIHLEGGGDTLHGNTAARPGDSEVTVDLVGEGITQGYRGEEHLYADDEVLVACRDCAGVEVRIGLYDVGLFQDGQQDPWRR